MNNMTIEPKAAGAGAFAILTAIGAFFWGKHVGNKASKARSRSAGSKTKKKTVKKAATA